MLLSCESVPSDDKDDDLAVSTDSEKKLCSRFALLGLAAGDWSAIKPFKFRAQRKSSPFFPIFVFFFDLCPCTPIISVSPALLWRIGHHDWCLLTLVLVYLHIGWGLCDRLCLVLVCRGRYGLGGVVERQEWRGGKGHDVYMGMTYNIGGK